MLLKKKIIIISTLLLLVTMSFLGGQAYAKYVASVRGQGVAEVATWSFKVNDQKEQVETINLASTCDNETLIDNKIAPGTSGTFNIKVDGTGSDVGIDYNISFTNEQNKPTNLKYIYEDGTYNSITEIQDKLSGTINANDSNKVKIIPIKWEWKYETGERDEVASNDKIDTQNAESISNYTFDVVVTGTQVKPQE